MELAHQLTRAEACTCFLAGGDWITSVGDMAATDIWEVYRYDCRGENFCVQPTFTAELSQQRKPLLI